MYSTPPDDQNRSLDGSENEEIGILNPFNPALIDIDIRQMSLDTLTKRIKENEIDLSPDFQRKEVWKIDAKSKLIESILIRIPLPAFYMDGTDDDKWVVVDGLQRLSTIRDFIINGTLRLQQLEYLTDLNNKTFQELPRQFQRRIEETQITAYIIKKGTPEEVKFNVFKRINTGGLPLSPQEIRHALNQGPSTQLLKELSECHEFLKATCKSINPSRMDDRECILRALAFIITPYSSYKENSFDIFLIQTMRKINAYPEKELANLKNRFIRCMSAAHKILGKNAFRKYYPGWGRGPINKALFETWTVNLNNLNDDHINKLIINNKDIINKFSEVLNTDDQFIRSITQATGDPKNIKYRQETLDKFLRDFL
ncbi:MAG: DUF262 domain-containing protein [Thermodesulfobacteriota bacterium]